MAINSSSALAGAGGVGPLAELIRSMGRTTPVELNAVTTKTKPMENQYRGNN